MLSKSENNYLTQVGLGTPMGNLLRSYWIPLLYSNELQERDGAPKRIRLLGENLIAFRDSSNHIGLLNQHCPHRRASLFYGRNEDNGLRCLYHGWKFNTEGQCVDIPNEPRNCKFQDKVKIKSYPCMEAQGIIWTYMGKGEPPPLPEMGWAKVPFKQKSTLKYLRECNWVQAMEGDFDSSHLSFLHLAFDEKLQETKHEEKWGTDYFRNIARMYKKPELKTVCTESGVICGAKRKANQHQDYWRVSQFQLPFYTSVPAYLGLNRLKVWVPVDDENTVVWEANWNMQEELSEEQRKGWKNRVGPSGFEEQEERFYGAKRFAANKDNDYYIDRERQKNFNFSGMENVTPIQDGAMQESMGTIVDRSQEYLSASDAAIIQMRKYLLNSAKSLELEQKMPKSVFQPHLYHSHGEQMLLSKDENWFEAFQMKMNEAYANL